MTMRNFKARDEVIEKLEYVKEHKGMNKTWVINEAILEYIENHNLCD